MSSVLTESIPSRLLGHARLCRLLVLGAPVFFATVALLLGKKTGWDVFNYHWYNPFAFLNGRFGSDVAVGHNASYYNPLADIPLYLIGAHGPAWAVGVFLGAMAGVVAALIGAIAYASLPISDERHRLSAAALIALLGMSGAGAFQEIGDPANDIPAAIGSFAALLILILNLPKLESSGIDPKSRRVLLLSGVCAGTAVALKLTTAIYALGIAAAMLTLSGTFVVRVARAAILGTGIVIGLVAVGGYWMWTLWQYSGNPFFPYFNDFFQSPLLADAGYLDRNFRPPNWTVRLLFPFYFTSESHYVSESSFKDAHVLALYVLIPLSVSVVSLKKVKTLPTATKLLFAFAAVSYVAWLAIFDIYRYLIPLEILSSLLIALAILAWPIAIHARLAVIAVVFLVLQLVVRIDLSDRQTWTGPYVQVGMPAKPIEREAMILMTGHEPMSYVIPSFPGTVPFLRIDGWLVQGNDSATGLAREMRARVASHSGPLYLLSAPKETEAALAAIEQYRLQVDLHSPLCAQVTSNISIALSLCPVSRR